MTPFWKIFVAIFCYISGIVGVGLAVVNASEKPPATTWAIVYGALGVVFLAGGITLSRRPRY
jgi:hypothetical protein